MTHNDEAFKQLSHSISCVRFPLVVAILLLHAYTAAPSLGHGTYFRVLYPFALWFGETGVPAYFFISGLLMFYSKKTYSQQLKSRFRSLFIPYMLWNGLFLFAYIVAWKIGFNMEINNKSLADYNVIDYLRAFWDRGDWANGNSMPVLTPMWYIRNLMIVYIISPLVFYVIRATGLLLFLAASLFWINTHNVAFILQTVTMMSLGAYFSIKGINPITFLNKYKILVVIFFVFFGLGDIFLHQGIINPNNVFTSDISLPFHRLALIGNTFIILLIGSFLYKRGWHFPNLSKAAFFIFCIHYPLNAAVRSVAKLYPQWPDMVHILLYVASVAIVILICYGLFRILNRYQPWFIRISTGGRS